MLALARHHEWPISGYQSQAIRCRSGSSRRPRWTGIPSEQLLQAVDGCTTVCFGLPLEAMALAYARFAATRRRRRCGSGRRVRHPDLVRGAGGPATDIMTAGAGRLVAKIGADGSTAPVYSGWTGSGDQGGRRRHAVLIGRPESAC
jgi:L-asparaginase II